MTNFPTIRTARYLAKKLGLQGVVIIAVGDGQVAAASYGATVKQCKTLAPLVDLVISKTDDGTIDMSAFT